MAREGRSHVRKRKKGCLVGCLTNLLLVLGVAALLFVGAHVLGFVKSDPQTGAPTLRFDNLPEIKLGDFDLSKIELPDVSKLTEKLPKWAYGVNPNQLKADQDAARGRRRGGFCLRGRIHHARRRGQRNGRGALRPASALRREPPERGGCDGLGG